ncbi:MAG TPA: hypothetical protein VH989_11285 [Actinomycetota bacterium]
MTTWLLVWLVVSLVVGGALAAILVGLIQRLIVLSRALRQFQDELQPTADAIKRESARAAERSGSIGERAAFRRA